MDVKLKDCWWADRMVAGMVPVWVDQSAFCKVEMMAETKVKTMDAHSAASLAAPRVHSMELQQDDQMEDPMESPRDRY